MVLAVPTASGKTLVAELAMTKNVLEKSGKALYLVPLRALASEKYEEFKKYEIAGIKVAISTGDYDSSDPWLANYDIIVVTNEKADSLLRHRASWIEDISIIVADEIHLINDPSRGPTLEVVLARLKQINPEAQIIALSATIRNAEEIAEWLQAKLIKSDWRPVPLRKGVYFKGAIFFDDDTIIKLKKITREPCEAITIDTLKNGGQILIFTNTRQNAVKMALKLAPIVSKYLEKEEKNELRKLARLILERGEVTRISEQLASCISCGTAFHHAGLIHEHRKIIEDAFRNFKIKAICATPTLAAGVNLPARRVVIRHYHRYDYNFGYQNIPVLEFHQMAGRAGRPKYDKYGEAILIAKTIDEKEFLMENYIKAPPERIWSKLATEPALRSHILAIIATEYAKTIEGLM
ncbi:MAG: extensin, partial [Candidatus Methanomethylicota archaeon]